MTPDIPPHRPFDSPTRLDGLRVAVTGGTSGLGRALVENLWQLGARVAFVARNAERVNEVAGQFSGTHGIAGDVSRREQTHAIALRITAALGGLDVLINNASSVGPLPLAPLADTATEDLQTAFDTNVIGPFRLTQALMGALGATAWQGRPALVINVSSDAGVEAYAGWGAYGASKAALSHMSRIWDEEVRAHRLRIHAFDPGDMNTPMHAAAVPDADPSTLKSPADAAREVVAIIDNARKTPAPVA
jgi:NAD(P)-dependent dehydrogenase (short-subunit alcohol dehydrogenase family)